jgi:intracellular multiplication protein IcmB
MRRILKPLTSTASALLSFLGVSLNQSVASYCDLQTADSHDTLVNNDGSLVSIIEIDGVKNLVGRDEYLSIQEGLQQALQTTMSQSGHTIQVLFNYSKTEVKQSIKHIFEPATVTCKNIKLNLGDLFSERLDNLSRYCADEKLYMVLMTKPNSLTPDQNKTANKEKIKRAKEKNIPAFSKTQNVAAAIIELRDRHDSFVGSVKNDFDMMGLVSEVMPVHDAVHAIRSLADPEFTDAKWRPVLPGDKVTVKELKQAAGDESDVLWPSLSKQILPRDGERLDLRTVRFGDRIYSTVYIDLFPQEVQIFSRLMSRTIQARMPWRISFLIDSNGLGHSSLRSTLASILTFTSAQNRLLSNSLKLLSYVKLNTDDAVVRLRVAATTWAPVNKPSLLRSRASMLAKAIEGWGSCDVSEISGDAFHGVMATNLAITSKSPAQASVAPLSEVLRMLPMFRPSSPWDSGAILFRSPDGKPWPYHPGSRHQTTFIDLIYARPGSGKSVLSNAINLAVCMSPGIMRLPRIAVIDIGPSSSGLISLLKDALPVSKKHLVAHHRLRMTKEYSINPFDTQLGCRYPSPLERTFLVNFLTLLTTPIGADNPYDGVPDMAGLIVDELYKSLDDNANPHTYAANVEEIIDGLLIEIDFVADQQTSWWEITDALFLAGFSHEAMLAQRHAMPVLADIASIARTTAVEDLYGKITAKTGESLIHSFSRMISSAVREYPIISQVTKFDLGDAKVVALDLDEVAKSGGDAANRQTSVMYMLARYVLAKNYYVTEESVNEMPEVYRDFHRARISEIREDPKRLVYDEFHRTSHSKAVRDQVIVDMREGRKWKVQVALLSQSLDDFDSVMVEFATSIFIMDAGPEVTIQKAARVFGLTETAQSALRSRVHGPRKGGATFLGIFSTKDGRYTQLLTNTLGPIELWALTTTAEDAFIRNALYKKVGPKNARSILAKYFPSGSAMKEIEENLSRQREEGDFIDDNAQKGALDVIIDRLEKAVLSNQDER